MNRIMTRVAVIATAIFALAACNSRTGWRVDGTIDGAEKNTALAIEGFNAGRWYVLDSVYTDGSGKFRYDAAMPMPGSEVLRLTYPGKGSVYFPVDSMDAVTISAVAANFGTGHTLSGTEAARAFTVIDSTVVATADMEDLRRKLTNCILADTTGIVAYYAVGKSVGNKAIFDPNDSFGNRIYGAVAQIFAHYKPSDPRGALITRAYLEGRRALGKLTSEAPSTAFEVPEVNLIDIVRYDDKGVEHSLAEVASHGKVVLLSFADYSTESSPAYNAILNDLYTLYNSRGLEIYQIAFDGNEVAWKEAARNLPWITVWNSPSDGIAALTSYNVGAVPLTFVINRNGELTKRVADPTELAKEVAKYF